MVHKMDAVVPVLNKKGSRNESPGRKVGGGKEGSD